MNEDELSLCFLKMKGSLQKYIQEDENISYFPRSENWHLYLVNFHEIQEILRIVFSDSGQSTNSKRQLFLQELSKRKDIVFNYNNTSITIPNSKHKREISAMFMAIIE